MASLMNTETGAFWIEWSGRCIWKGDSIQSENELLNLIGRIYSAGAGETPWSHCLGEIARLSRSRAAVVQVMGLESRNVVQLEQVNIEAEELQEYGNYLPSSPRLEFGSKIPFGQIFSDYDFISESEMDKSEYYSDFLAKWGFRYFAAGAFIISPTLLGHFSIQRTQSEGHVDDEQIRLLERLFPHVKRAMQFEWQARALRHERDSAVDALDKLTHGVIWVTTTGQVVRANHAADHILSKQDGLRIRDGVLLAANQPDTLRLHTFIAKATHSTGGERLDPEDILSIARSSARRQPLSVSITPLSNDVTTSSGLFGSREPLALLFVHDPETYTEVSSVMLQQLYGLTPAEVRLVTSLVNGAHLKVAAERFEISLETARTQLKAIFGKTGTRWQSDLIRLILTGPAVIRML